jgi:hypothetical protein
MSEEEYWMRRLLVSLKQHAINQCSDVQKLERDKKDRHLKALKEKGLSARQLARLTGISRSIILKPHNRNLTARTVPLVTQSFESQGNASIILIMNFIKDYQYIVIAMLAIFLQSFK